MNIIARIDSLSDDRALWALDYIGRVFAAANGIPPMILAKRVEALEGLDNSIPEIADGKVVGGPDAEVTAGIIARHALKIGLNDPRTLVRHAVGAAVAEATEPAVTAEVVTIMLIGSALVVGLAALAKLEVTADGKVIVHPGLPDIKDAGAAIGTLVKSALGQG